MEEWDTEWPLESIVESLGLYAPVTDGLSQDTWTLKWLENCHALLIRESFRPQDIHIYSTCWTISFYSSCHKVFVS